MRGISVALAAVLVFFLLAVQEGMAEEKEAKQTTKADTVTQAVEMDSATVTASDIWMKDVWKRVSELTAKQRTFEREQPASLFETGSRGEDIEDQLYFKEKDKAPSRQEIKEAIVFLRERAAENLYLLGQCYVHLGEEEEALAAYSQLLQLHPNCKWAQEAKEGVKCLEKEAAQK
jgi:tetratricopeptide (TPR) repeat protein